MVTNNITMGDNMKKQYWMEQQIITTCKNGGWEVELGANYDMFGVLDAHVVVHVSHRFATMMNDSKCNERLPAKLVYNMPWEQ
jgi:hypothetical protein